MNIAPHEEVRPDLVVPAVEALATDVLLALQAEGLHPVPIVRATRLTTDREGIRRLAAEQLGLPTSPYRFAMTQQKYTEAVEAVGRLWHFGVIRREPHAIACLVQLQGRVRARDLPGRDRSTR